MGLQNNAKKWVRTSIIIMLIGIAMIIAGITIDDYNFYWMIYVGAILFLTFLIAFFMFANQANRLDRLFRGEELLVHWKFEENERLAKTEEELIQRKAQNKVMLLIIAGFFVVIGALFVIFGFDDIEEALLFILIMVGVLAFISVVALITPGSRYRKMKNATAEVFVGPYSVWVMGEYVQWKAPLTKITSIIYSKDREDNYTITINYFIWQRYGPQPHTCRVPVPLGHETEAESVASDLARINNVKYINKLIDNE